MKWNNKTRNSFLDELTEKLILITSGVLVVWWLIEKLIDFFGGQ